MALDQKAEDPVLLVRSGEESFPSEALDEIRQERMLGAEDDGDFPPCRVEIVLGAKGRLYVVLPTGVVTVRHEQDPAHPVLDIDDVVATLTNRPGYQHVVITGRDPQPRLLEIADVATEMTKIAHPFDKGQKGQKGIEW